MKIPENIKFFIKVYGCQYNEWDGARLSFLLQKFGLVESDEKEADVILLLNCSVRKTAVDRAMSMVKNWSGLPATRLSSPKSGRQGKKIIVAGCILSEDQPKFLKKGVQIWDGESLEKLIKIIGINRSVIPSPEGDPLGRVEGSSDKKISPPSSRSRNDNKAGLTNYIPIMKGCDNFCSYCAVPYTRGREVSRPITDIVDDAKKMISAGRKEIILLGQNVNSYRPLQLSVISSDQQESRDLSIKKDFSTLVEMTNKLRKGDFAILLEEINALPGDFVIKFTSNHPKDMSDDIIETIAKLPKVAKEIHLPLQSGSNKILKAMNRPYTIEQYLEIVEKIRKKIPDAKISTDTIIGFPGETENDFQQTVEILKKVKFVQVFNNKYSPRSGTVAFALGDPIPWPEKERRWHILNEISNRR